VTKLYGASKKCAQERLFNLKLWLKHKAQVNSQIKLLSKLTPIVEPVLLAQKLQHIGKVLQLRICA
ncbi:large cysteine-rich periplasmic protein omcB, partial [Chlamydia psittaci C6/98]